MWMHIGIPQNNYAHQFGRLPVADPRPQLPALGIPIHQPMDRAWIFLNEIAKYHRTDLNGGFKIFPTFTETT